MNKFDVSLYGLSSDKLIEIIIDLRNEIRRHRDAQGHDLCWQNNLDLYELLPEKVIPQPEVPEPLEFIQKCCEYRKMLDEIKGYNNPPDNTYPVKPKPTLNPPQQRR